MEKAGKSDVSKWLSGIAPIGELEGLLKPPSSLFRCETGYSSEKETDASALSGFLFAGLELPKDLPKYAISIIENKGERHLVIVDLKRGFIVESPIRASEGFFESAILSIRCAVRESEYSKTLVLSNEEGISKLARKRSP